MSGSIVYVSTYLPRKCGIATFTQDLKNAVEGKGNRKGKVTLASVNIK